MISPSKRGSCVEYKAVVLFTEAGFEVFKNAHPDGPADLVVWDGENFYPVDLKKVSRYVRADGSVGYSGGANRAEGVSILGYCHQDGWMWLQEPPEALLNLF